MDRLSPFEEGELTAPLALLGEAPADREMREGRPFVGDAGRVLDRCLLHAGIERSGVYITNCFEAPVRKNAQGAILDRDKETLWSPTKGFTEKGLAQAQGALRRLASSRANVIVPLGAVAMSLLIPGNTKVGKWRGSILLGEGERKLVPTYHPATVCWGSTHLQHVIATDLARAKAESAFPEVRRRPRELILNPKLTETLAFLGDIRYERPRTFFDIELFGGQLSAISFATSPERAISIPFICEDRRQRWSEREERVILEAIADILWNERIPKGNQNVTFDVHLLAELYGMVTRGTLDDPMVLHSLIFPDLEKSLAFQCSWLTDVPYYKDDGGRRAWEDPWRDLGAFWRYSALDACVALEAFETLERDYLGEGSPYKNTYRETMELVGPLAFMMLRGQRVDEEAMGLAREGVLKEREGLLREFEERTGGVNPASPLQLCKLFYETLGNQPYLNKEGRPTTDVFAMKRLARKGVKEAELLLRLRGLKKRQEELEVKLREGRLHTSYNIRGTKTGRLSSAEDEFETGGNVQNKTSGFKTFLISDEESVDVVEEVAVWPEGPSEVRGIQPHADGVG